MRRTLLVWLVMVVMVVGRLRGEPAAADSFVLLDPYDPRGINNRGDIAGVWTAPNRIGHGVLLSDGTVTFIDAPAAECLPQFPEFANAYGVNDRRQVVGQYLTNVLGPTGCEQVGHGFFWSDGVFTTIDAPGGGILTLTGINNAGDMVGFVEGGGGFQGGVLVSHGTFTALPLHPDSLDFPIPFGINDRGDIVGDIGGDAFLLSRGRYTLWRVPESGFTEARGINDRGDIVGFWVDAEGTSHGYVLSKGQLTEIHVPVGTVFVLSGINNRGQVTGRYADETGRPHGFLLQVR
jgi:uncharacterized membrane protein